MIADLRTKTTPQNPESRLQWKLNLVRRLYERGYSREDVVQLFRFIDWIMILPKELASSFKQGARSYEEGNRMRYVTSIERLAKEEGKEEGIVETTRENAIDILETRFGEVPNSIVEMMNAIDDVSVLKTLLKRGILIGSLADFQQVLEEVVLGE